MQYLVITGPNVKKTTRQHTAIYNVFKRHPQLDWGSHDLVKKRQIPDQIRDDGKKNKIAMSHTPRNDTVYLVITNATQWNEVICSLG